MRVHFIIYCVCFLSVAGSYAQTDTFEIERSVFATTGLYWEDPASGLSLSYTVGETVIETVSSLQGTLVFTQGFQQSGTEDIVGIDDLEFLVDYQIYPNPTPGPITVELRTDRPMIMYLEIYDMIGQKTPVPTIEARFQGRFATRMDLTELSDGVYLLAMLNEAKQIVHTFRIEKYF